MEALGSYKTTIEKLAFEAPITIYRLNKETGYSTSTIHASIHKMIDNDLVERTKNGYRLTATGLIKVLQEEAVWEQFDKIVSSNKETLSDYFELWDTFKKFKVDRVAVKLLKYAIRKLSSAIPTYPEKIDGRKPTLKDWLPRLAIYPYEAMLEEIITREEADRWFDMVLEVPKAEKLYLNTLTWMDESHRASAKIWRQAIEKYHELKAWHSRSKRVAAIVESIKDPYERLKTLKHDRDLWETVLRMYEVESEKELLEKMVKKGSH